MNDWRSRWTASVPLLLLLASLLPAAAVELVRGPSVTFTNGRPVVQWATDVASGSRVQFGEVAARMTRRADGAVDREHLVVLPELPPGSRWFYSVGTARYPLVTNWFQVPVVVGAGRLATSAVKPSPPAAPPSRVTWGNPASLPDHFHRHGRDFRARDAEEYARLAWEFRQRARAEGLPTKVDEDGVERIFDPHTRSFGAYNRDGTTRTFFKPESPTYFQRQPGRLVSPQGGK